MERSIVAVVEKHQRADPSNGGPNSLGSLVKIDSISIDLGITMARKNDMADNCRHFTIRGYVAEMREKDSTLCDPFSMFRKHSTPKEQFPPKCRRWECKKCPRDINNTASGADSKCCEKEIIACSSRLDKSHLSECQAVEIYDRKKDDMNANSGRNSNIIVSNNKGKNVVVEDPTAKNHYNSLEENAGKEIVRVHADISAASQSRDSQSVEISESNREIQDAAGALLAIEYPTCEIGRFNDVEKVDKGTRNRLPSFDSDEFDVASDDPNNHYENRSTSARKKPQKIRLLTDLFEKNDKHEKDKRRMPGDIFPNGFPNLSNDANSLTPERERKRKMDEDKQMEDSNWLRNFGKKPRTLKGDEDHNKFAIEISDSETEDADAFVVNKSKSKKHGSDHRNPILVQKKNKQVQFGDQYFPVGSWGDVPVPKYNHNKLKESEQIGAGGNFPEFESHFKNYSPQGKESSNSSKKKNRYPHIEERQSFFMPQSRSNDIRFLQDPSESAKSTMGLDLSLSGFMNVERTEKNHVAQAVEKNGFIMPRPKSTSSKDSRPKEGIFIGEPSVLRKSIPDPFTRDRLNYEFNQKNAHQQQNCTPRFENGSFSMRHNTDLSGPSNINRQTEANCRLEPARIQNEKSTSEEIPMEIVELMAKNQYERSLCEAEKNNYKRNDNNKRTNPEMIMGFPNKVHNSNNNGVMRILPKEYPSMRKPPPTEHVGPSKQNHIHFFAADQRNRFHMAPQEENPGMRMFDAFSQQSIRFQNSFQNVNNHKPQQFWSFRPPQHVSEDRQIPEKNKGKVVREFDLNRVAPNNINNNSDPFSGMMSMAYHAPAPTPAPPPDRNPKVMASSFDSFSQDAIPAMQLLSLMDAGLNTSKPFDVYPKRGLEKPFYPCGNHPNFTMDKPLYPGNYTNSKSNFPGVVYKPVESSRHPSASSLNSFGKNQAPDNFSCECAADSQVPIFNTDRNSKRPVNTENRIYFKPRSDHQTPQNKPRKSHKHGSTVLEFKSGHDNNKQKNAGSSSKRVDLEHSNSNVNAVHANPVTRNEVCTLNQNPADFSVPEEDNEFTINGEDLRFPKKNSPKVTSKISRQ